MFFFLLVNEQQRNEDKHEDKRQQQDEPGNARGAGAANQVQYPGPEQDVDGLDDENHGRAGDVASETADAVLIDHAHILVQENDQGDGRNDQVNVRRGTQITQSSNHGLYIYISVRLKKTT
jgi:hypothetical protein